MTRIADAAGQGEGRRYHVFDVFGRRYVGVRSSEASIGPVPAHGVLVASGLEASVLDDGSLLEVPVVLDGRGHLTLTFAESAAASVTAPEPVRVGEGT